MQKVKKYKISRRLGAPIYEKCQTQKFISREARRGTGKKGRRGRGMMSLSEYGKQLIEKQKAQYTYGIREKQIKKYVRKAEHNKEDSNDALIVYLESRLDNVIYRAGLASTRRFARQLVSHGHIMVHGKRVTVPSFEVKIGDVIEIKERSKKTFPFQGIPKNITKLGQPKWIKVDPQKLTFTIAARPFVETSIFDIAKILEYYSR